MVTDCGPAVGFAGGRGSENPLPYKRLARYLGVGDRVRFAGGTKDPYSFYRAADFFVLPTRHDPCSLVVLESLAMGVPVISTVFNGACEIMEGDRHGVVLDNPGDTKSLSAAMQMLLDPVRRGEMAKACLELRPALSDRVHLEALTHIYEKIRSR